MKRSSIASLISQRFRSEGLVLGAASIAAQIFVKLRSRLLGALLGARDLHVGGGCRFQGRKFITLGRGVRARSNLWVEAIPEYLGVVFNPRIVIGDRVIFSNAVHIAAVQCVEIGNDVLFGSGVLVSDHNHGSYGGSLHSSPGEAPADRPLDVRGPVVIEDKVWLGDNVNIVGPARIGSGAVIGANSVVRGDVPARSIVVGSPARVIKRYDESSAQWVAVSR